MRHDGKDLELEAGCRSQGPSAQALLRELNEPQRQAVEHRGGPLMVLAGAGSGKTRVVTYRIAHLLATGEVKPRNVLAVTFTNKAAREMRERVWKLLEKDQRELWVGTFHSTCARILRGHAHLIGYPREFSILDERDRSVLIKECCQELNLATDRFPLGHVVRQISWAKQAFLSPDRYRAKRAHDQWGERMASLYALYQTRLVRLQAMDFDDLLFWVLHLFLEHPQVLELYRNRWTQVLVDEFQDTNEIQYRIVKMLAEKHRQICVVGDDDQSIYSWRGANPANILEFDRDFPEVRIVRLEQNYRSTQRIIEASSSLIRQNIMRKGKELWTANETGEPLTLYLAQDEREEARFVAREIRHLLLREGMKPGELAVFYRTHAQSRILEEELLSCQVPFSIYGGVGFYERKEIKDVVAYLRALVYPADDLSWKRILNVPRRGIGAKTVEAVEGLANARGIPFSQALSVAASGGLRAGASKIKGFLELMELLREVIQKEGLAAGIRALVETTGYLQELRGGSDPLAEDREENLAQLVNMAADYESEQEEGDLLGFLERVSLYTDLDLQGSNEDRVSLMTLHSAKGLEFRVVFLVGMEEGLLPHASSLEHPAELEEERRLCYVGITRARERLYLCLAASRRVWGLLRNLAPSRFLSELPEGSLRPLGQELLSNPSELPHKWPPSPRGRWVRHHAFGVGSVVRTELAGQRLIVYFPGVGEKRFVTEDAPLEWL